MMGYLTSRAEIGTKTKPWDHATMRASVWLDDKNEVCSIFEVESGAGGIHLTLTPDSARHIRDMADQFLKNHTEILHQQAIAAEAAAAMARAAHARNEESAT